MKKKEVISELQLMLCFGEEDDPTSKALSQAIKLIEGMPSEEEMAIIVDKEIRKWKVKPNGFVVPITNIAKAIYNFRRVG